MHKYVTRAAGAGVAAVVLMAAAACSPGPVTGNSTGVPESWYSAISEAIDDQPDVGSIALLENGGPCPLRDSVTVDGRDVADVSDHGVVRLDGEIPAVSCSWYEGTPIEVTMAKAADDTQYADLVAGTLPVQQAGNEQSGHEVVVGARTLQVVRTVYPSNASAGTDFEAFYLDQSAWGRVSLRVSNSDERSAGYDEAAVAADLAGFLNG